MGLVPMTWIIGNITQMHIIDEFFNPPDGRFGGF